LTTADDERRVPEREADMSASGPGSLDAGPFLARLVRIDRAALVRLRPVEADRLALWARLPWGVLVTRTVPGSSADRTYAAADLLAGLSAGSERWPAPRDAQWHWPLPGRPVVTVEEVPAAHVRELGTAAERTVRAGLSRAGERVVRDAVLDHVAITVTKTTPANIEHIEVPQRLVQAVVRMGFLRRLPGDDEPTIRVVRTGRFVGLAGEYGAAWYRPEADLPIQPLVRSDEPS
jgi:hypothetical protein